MKKIINYGLLIFLVLLLLAGYLINKNNSYSKKNEIKNFAKQLSIRNKQIAKIQRNLLKNENNINDLINIESIDFEKKFENLKLNDFIDRKLLKENKINKKINEYLFSKYTTEDILFSGNINANGTAFIDFFNEDQNLIIATYDGIFGFSKLKNIKNFRKINSNFQQFINYDEFYSNLQYGIKDIFINDDKIYVSYIDEEKKDCYDLKIITANINYEFLKFKEFFKPSNCINTNNSHGYWPHQGAGGRIFSLDDA